MKRSISEQRMQTYAESEKGAAASAALASVPQSAAGPFAGSAAGRTLPHQSSLRVSTVLPGAAPQGASVISTGGLPSAKDVSLNIA